MLAGAQSKKRFAPKEKEVDKRSERKEQQKGDYLAKRRL